MNRNSLASEVATTSFDTDPQVARAVCPMCHTIASTLTLDALGAGIGWRCVTCDQRWDASRLATVAAYAAWVIEHDRLATVTNPAA